MNLQKIGFGGGCHWCTEAIFQALIGVTKVEQGYIKSTDKYQSFSEAVLLHYDVDVIPLKDLIEIHLHTHKSTSNHSFREKYRSAIYFFDDISKNQIEQILLNQQNNFQESIITKALPFSEFLSSRADILNYYTKNPEKPFCKKYIHPKLELLRNKYSERIKTI